MDTVLPLTAGRKLRLFQRSDPYKQWWSLEETRFCAKCEHLFIGREIKVFEDESGGIHFRCPTRGCDGTFADWEYPQLHLKQRPNRARRCAMAEETGGRTIPSIIMATAVAM